MNKTTLKYSFMRSLPVMAGYIVLGIGFGVLLADKGYSFWWAVLMSTVVLAGTLQYVGVELLATGASLISTILMSLMINARHLFYGISMLKKYGKMGWKRFYAIFALTDETYSLVCTDDVPDGVDREWYYFLLSMMNHSYWIIGSFIGAFHDCTLCRNAGGAVGKEQNPYTGSFRRRDHLNLSHRIRSRLLSHSVYAHNSGSPSSPEACHNKSGRRR